MDEKATCEAKLQESEKAVSTYDYAGQEDGSDDEYDYESPYWAPADRKAELLNQFRKLRIQSVTQKDLE